MRLITFLLNLPRAGLQTELDAFFDHALSSQGGQTLSKSALCQARRDLNPDAMRSLLQHSSRAIRDHSEVRLWQGRRVLALDSTVLRVPNVPECAEAFVGMRCANGAFRPLARASALLDVGRDCLVDAVIGGYDQDDRSLAEHHLDHLGPDDLLVMDRGYPSREWLRKLMNQEIGFCARIAHRRWAGVVRFVSSGKEDEVVDLGTPEQPLSVRLLRHVLPNGTLLILATNILDQALQASQFAELYRKRWRIEEVFKLLKARLQIENWSGYLPHTVQQDFYAALIRANCAAIIALEARPDLNRSDADGEQPSTVQRIRLNQTYALKSLRHYLPKLLLGLDAAQVLAMLIKRLRSVMAVERTKSGRQAERPAKDKVRVAGFNTAYKAA